MSPADEEEARDTLDRAERGSCIYDPQEHRTLLKMLWAYDHGGDYAGFAQALQLKPTDALERTFELAHFAYIEAWNRYGWDTLVKMVRTGWNYLYADDWSLV